MKRRTFVFAASGSLALLGNQALAQRTSQTATVLTSELTGGQVDYATSGLEMVNQHIDDADGSEHMHFGVENGGQFDIIFWPPGGMDSSEFVEMQVNMFLSVMPDSELIASDTYDDGGWFAFDVGNIGYYEYQRGAYGDHDLVILMNADPAEFADYFEQAQSVMVDGMSPFLFADDSGILALAAERLEATSATTPASSGRTSRSSRSATTSATEAPEEPARSTRSSSQSTTAESPTAAVETHRSEFLASYDTFYSNLEIAGEETATDIEVEDAFALMLNEAFLWQGYPATAAEIAFPAEYASLESAYLDWADCVGELGFSFEAFATGDGDVDSYLAVFDEWKVLDDSLVLELESVGSRQKHRSISRHSQRQFHRAMSNMV